MSEYYKNLISYKNAMMMAEMLLNDQVITREEYNKIDTIMTKKYAISSSTIFSNMR